MRKNAQLSIFLIFIIVIVIAIGFLMYINSIKTKEFEKEVAQIKKTPFSLDAVRLNIDSCIKNTAEDAVIYVGLFGGYYNVSEPKIDYLGDEVPYYVYEGNLKAPTISAIETQISDYLANQLPDCIYGLNNTFNYLQIEGKLNSVNVSIEYGNVFFDIDLPIWIGKGDSKTKISKFATRVPARLKTVYETALNISLKRIENKDSVCIDCLIELASENDVFIEVYPYEENSLIFTVFDNVTKVDGDDYIFTFATN